MNTVRSILILAICLVVTWYICEGLLWLEFKMKVYTTWGKTMAIWGEHFVFLIIGLIATLSLKPI